MSNYLSIYATNSAGGTASIKSHTMGFTNIGDSNNGGFTAAFALKISSGEVGDLRTAIEQSIKFAMRGKAIEGHQWGMELNLTFYNGGDNPTYLTAPSVPPTSGCERLNGTDTTQNLYARRCTWLMPSYDWLWSTNATINPDPNRKKQAMCKLNGFTKRVLNPDGSELLRKHYGWTATADPAFLPVGESLVPFSIEIVDNQWYFFDIYLAHEGESYFKINGYEILPSFFINDHNDATFPLPEIAVGNDIEKVDIEISAAMVKMPTRIDLANIWMGLVELSFDQMVIFSDTLYNKKDALIKTVANKGAIQVSNNRVAVPNFYWSGNNGMINDINQETLVTTKTNTEINSIPHATLTTIIEAPYNHLVQMCSRPQFKANERDYFFNELTGGIPNPADQTTVAASGVKKTFVYFLDSTKDWSKFFFYGIGKGALVFDLVHKPSTDISTHKTFRYYHTADGGEVVQANVFSHVDGRTQERHLSFKTVTDLYPGFNPLWVTAKIDKVEAVYSLIDNFGDADLQLRSGHNGGLVSVAPPSTTLAMEGFHPLPDYPIGTYLVLRFLESAEYNPRCSTALMNFSIFSKTAMDQGTSVPWNNPHLMLDYIWNISDWMVDTSNASARVLRDFGLDGSLFVGVKPDFYFTPRNGLGVFANSADGKFCVGNPYCFNPACAPYQVLQLALNKNHATPINMLTYFSASGSAGWEMPDNN